MTFLPFNPPISVSLARRIKLTCAKNEYEAASFAIFAPRPLKAVTVHVTPIARSDRPSTKDAGDLDAIRRQIVYHTMQLSRSRE